MQMHPQRDVSDSAQGFTLIELLTVVAIISILAALIIPTLATAREKGRTTMCLNNLRQLQLAWQMYTDDHGGLVPENDADLSNDTWRSSQNSWTGPSSAPRDPGDWALRQGVLFRYDYVQSTAVFRCPSDAAEATDKQGRTENVNRSRSYSMNGNFGGRKEESQSILKRDDMNFDPVTVFLFIDEHVDSIDDGHFLTWPAPDERWVNLPTSRHNQGATLSFIDGHVEYWKWRWQKDFSKKQSYWKQAVNDLDLADLRRLQESIVPLTTQYEPQD